MIQEQVRNEDGIEVAKPPINLFFTEGRMLDSEGKEVKGIGTVSQVAKLAQRRSDTPHASVGASNSATPHVTKLAQSSGGQALNL